MKPETIEQMIVIEAEQYSKISVTGYVEIGWSDIRGIEIAAYIAGRSKNIEREKELLENLNAITILYENQKAEYENRLRTQPDL